MRSLQRKLLRDLWHLKGQALAIALVIGAGVAMFVMYISTFHSLRLTQTAYYERNRFADVFAGLKRAPLSVRERVAAVPGVVMVDARIVVDVTLDVPDLSEPATGRLITVPVPREPMLNDVFLRRGRYLAPGRADEVLVSEAFALKRNLNPGDRIGAVINGRRRDLRIVGIALSPEYVYSIRPGELMPDDARFGVFWMERRALASAFNMEGGFNNLALRLSPDASPGEVIADVDRALGAYGGLGAIPRALQISHWFIDNEIRQLQTVGLVLPMVFLAVAAFLLNVVLTRIVSVQREQIAALKALGYTNRELGAHYAGWGLAIALVGAGVGTAAGMWLGSGMTELYNTFFKFPVLSYQLRPIVVVQAASVSLVAAVLGTMGAVGRAVSLPPAEAMRPEPPARYRESWLERAGLKRWLSQTVRMILRNIGRHPVRATTSVVGMVLSVAIMVLGTFFTDAINELMRVQFFVAQRQDITVSFVEPVSSAALHEITTLPGVIAAEPLRAVPVRLRSAHRSRQTAITGLVANPRLNRIIDVESGTVGLPADGLVLSSKLAAFLGASTGAAVTVEVLEGPRPVRTAVVAGVVDEYMGMNAYMEIGALRRLMREGPSLSGIYLQVDAGAVDDLYERLKRTPRVAGVARKRAAIESFQQTMAEMFSIMVVFNVIFSSIIAFGVVYNSARVSLSERTRDLASLRVLGFSIGEISFILLGELAALTLVALPLGLAAGYGFARLLLPVFDTELFRIPLIILPRTYAFAAITVIAAALISGLVVRRRLDTLDLVAVLKTRD